jgi:hypothetical protein
MPHGLGSAAYTGFSVSISKDIENWVSGGLIGRATADRLNAGLDGRPGRFRLGTAQSV